MVRCGWEAWLRCGVARALSLRREIDLRFRFVCLLSLGTFFLLRFKRERGRQTARALSLTARASWGVFVGQSHGDAWEPAVASCDGAQQTPLPHSPLPPRQQTERLKQILLRQQCSPFLSFFFLLVSLSLFPVYFSLLRFSFHEFSCGPIDK